MITIFPIIEMIQLIILDWSYDMHPGNLVVIILLNIIGLTAALMNFAVTHSNIMGLSPLLQLMEQYPTHSCNVSCSKC